MINHFEDIPLSCGEDTADPDMSPLPRSAASGLRRGYPLDERTKRSCRIDLSKSESGSPFSMTNSTPAFPPGCRSPLLDRCLDKMASDAAMFSFCTSTFSGTVSRVGAKFQIASIPADTSLSHTSHAASAGTAMMPMHTPILRVILSACLCEISSCRSPQCLSLIHRRRRPRLSPVRSRQTRDRT